MREGRRLPQDVLTLTSHTTNSNTAPITPTHPASRSAHVDAVILRQPGGQHTVTTYGYGYNANGQRTVAMNGVATGYLQRRQPAHRRHRPGAGTAAGTYTYDANGNQTTGGGRMLTYNDRDQTTAVNTEGAGYEDIDQAQRATLGTRSFLNTPMGVSRYTDPAATTDVIREPTGKLAALRRTGSTHYPITDALGSVIALTDAANDVTGITAVEGASVYVNLAYEYRRPGGAADDTALRSAVTDLVTGTRTGYGYDPDFDQFTAAANPGRGPGQDLHRRLQRQRATHHRGREWGRHRLRLQRRQPTHAGDRARRGDRGRDLRLRRQWEPEHRRGTDPDLQRPGPDHDGQHRGRRL
jgi:hypothetical protein